METLNNNTTTVECVNDTNFSTAIKPTISEDAVTKCMVDIPNCGLIQTNFS